MLTYLIVGTVKIPRRLKVTAFSIKCPLFCSHGKLIRLFSSVKSSGPMPRYEEMVAGEDYTHYSYSVMASNIVDGL